MTTDTRAVITVFVLIVGLPWLAAAIGYWLTGVAG